jgi:hypothetical protein
MPWTYQGQTISQPGAIVVADNSGISAPAGNGGRELVIVGKAGGGQPKTVLSFSNPTDAIKTLQSGEGLTAVLRAMKPSPDSSVAPSVVKFVRVDPATQSTLNLTNGPTTVVQLTSVGYGDYTNRISTQIQSGTIQGLKATVTLDNVTLTQDNIYQSLFTVQYVGASASGLVSVNNATGQIQGLAGASGSETVQWTASLSTYSTIQQLVNFINSQAGWVATITTANPNQSSVGSLDDLTSTPCKASPATITGTLSALVNWYNTTGIVTADRPANVGLLPSVMTAPAYLTGGSTGTATNNDWSSAFAVLQNEPLARIVVAVSSDPTIHAMVDAHCAYMSSPTIRKNRVQIAGGALGEAVSQVLTRAQNLNSRRTTLVWPGIQDFDPVSLQMTTFAPYIVAAQAGAILSATPVINALTYQQIACKGLEGNLQNTLQKADYDNLTNGGVMAVKFVQNQNGNAYRFVRSVTTWQVDQNLVNVELSCVCTEDYVNIRVGDAVDALQGQPGSPIGVGKVYSTIDGELRSLYEEGVLVGNKISDAYGNIQVTLNNGAVTSSFNATIPAPMNFFGVTTKFGIYSSTVAS